jgi:competence protein ComEC
MSQLQKKITYLLSSSEDRFILWAPAWLMLGIGIYFELPTEPPPYIGFGLAAFFGGLLGLVWQQLVRWLAFAAFLVAAGFGAAQLRAHMVSTPLIYYEMHDRAIEGTIEQIDLVEQKAKLTLSTPIVEYLEQDATPRRLRVSFKDSGSNWRVGDRVRFDATLFPLPPPDMPDAYDFGRHFYFLSIGGTGYAIHPPEIISNARQPGIHEWLYNLRRDIGDDMRSRMHGPAGTVAAAMTVGETGPIPDVDKILLRDAGLAHMLAIAGLHLGIVAGVVFFSVRLLLTLAPSLALRLPVKKIAAGCALLTAFIYLCLAGFPIPAQRAFIGAIFLFTAMLFDRRGISLRTLSLAAIFILLIMPESMFGPSFQLSFAATLAIISFYERFGREIFHRGQAWWQAMIYHAIGIAFSSAIATMATAPYVLYNFNRFAVFGLISNMVVIPLATFVIMPAMVLSLMLMPLGLQGIGYIPLQFGVDLMLSLSSWVTSLPYASLKLPSPSDFGLIACTIGLLWFCLRQGCKSLLGIPLMLIGLATITQHGPYDILVSNDATKVALRMDNAFLFIRGKPESFDGQTWLRYHGAAKAIALKNFDDADCDDISCSFDTHGKHLVVALHKGKTEGVCDEKSDITISMDDLTGAACKKIPLLIDRNYLHANGAVGIRFGKRGMEVETANAHRGTRLWTPAPQSELYVPDNTDIKSENEKE